MCSSPDTWGAPIRRFLRRVRTDAYLLDLLANLVVSYWAWPMISLVFRGLLFLLVCMLGFPFFRFLSAFVSFRQLLFVTGTHVAEIKCFLVFTLIHMRKRFHLTNYKNYFQTLVMWLFSSSIVWQAWHTTMMIMENASTVFGMWTANSADLGCKNEFFMYAYLKLEQKNLEQIFIGTNFYWNEFLLGQISIGTNFYWNEFLMKQISIGKNLIIKHF
jgi:hypothetical protein